MIFGSPKFCGVEKTISLKLEIPNMYNFADKKIYLKLKEWGSVNIALNKLLFPWFNQGFLHCMSRAKIVYCCKILFRSVGCEHIFMTITHFTS